MSFQTCLDNIREKTGKTPEDFKGLAAEQGLARPDVKAGEIIAWLKKDFGLGYGHAMAVVAVLRRASGPKISSKDKIGSHFHGDRVHWRASYDDLIGKLAKFGEGFSVAPTSSYLSLLNADKKFAVIQITPGRMDIGIKLKGVKPTARLEHAGTWNSMVTHRVRVTDAKQLDAALISWLRKAYEKT